MRIHGEQEDSYVFIVLRIK